MLFLAAIIYFPLIVIVSMCLSFLFKKKETAMGVLTTLLTLIVLLPFLFVVLSSIGQNSDITNGLHLTFTLIDPYYGIVGIFWQLFKVKFV